MPVEVQCPHCGKRLRAPDAHLGKQARCPQCKATITITPVEGSSTPSDVQRRASASAAQAASPGEQDAWYVMTGEEQQYGPVTKSELDSWLTEGRLDATCQVLKDGWEEWRWADQVYPSLKSAEAGQELSVDTATVETPALASAPTPTQPTSTPVQESAAEGEQEVPTRLAKILAASRQWVNLLSFIGFAAGAAQGGVGIWLLVGSTSSARYATSAVCLLLVVLHLVGSYLLLRYGQRLGEFGRSETSRDLELALEAQRTFWQTAGILAIVGALAWIGGVLAAMLA